MHTAPLANYHTHTARCNHASGREEEYIEMAIQNGFKILGFSDHVPFPSNEPYLHSFRMLCAELPDYVKKIATLKQQYSDQITIYTGFEVEYFPQYFPWLDEQIAKYNIDYLALGNHFDVARGEDGYFGGLTNPDAFTAYEQTSIAALESGKFCFFAHPDLFLNAYPVFDKACAHTSHAICEAAAALNVPLEYNLLGEDRRGGDFSTGLGYTRAEFWEIAAQHKVKAIIGCDAHDPKHLNHRSRILGLKEKLRANGIEVLDVLPGLT